MVEKAEDVSYELRYVLEAPQTNNLASDLSEKAFHQIEPRAGGRSKVKMEAFPAGKPGLDLGMLVSGVVVADNVDFFVGAH